MIKTIQKQLLLPREFGLKSQNYLKYFLIFTAWPVFSIFVSITLFLFVFLISEVKRHRGTNYLKADSKGVKFYIFAGISFLSLLFAPWDKLNIPLADDVQLQIQYVYWMLVSVFFMNTYKFINKEEFNKFVFIGLLLHTLHFFFFNFKAPIPFIRTSVSRNGFVYTVLALWPLASGYVYSRFGRSKGNWSLVLILFIMLLTDGRAGVVIIMIENIFIYFIQNRANAQLIRVLLIVMIPVASILGPEILNDENREAVGNLASSISPRIGDFIKGEGASGDLTFDKSWLTRKLMISKGVEILGDYPVLGVGIGHFSDYQASLAELQSAEFGRLGGSVYFDETYYNKKSAHNSYVHLASEMGILGFAMLMIILVPVVLYSLQKLYLLNITKDDLILVSLIGICIHFYTITSLPGTVTWFVLGLAYSRIYKAEATKFPRMRWRSTMLMPFSRQQEQPNSI